VSRTLSALMVALQAIRVINHFRVRRVAVVDTEAFNRVIGVITKSSLVRFLHRHRDSLSPLTQMKLGQFFERGGCRCICTRCAIHCVSSATHSPFPPSSNPAHPLAFSDTH
jgi:hypothetical protein